MAVVNLVVGFIAGMIVGAAPFLIAALMRRFEQEESEFERLVRDTEAEVGVNVGCSECGNIVPYREAVPMTTEFVRQVRELGARAVGVQRGAPVYRCKGCVEKGAT